MIFLWLLCVGLVLGSLLASLALEIPWGKLRFQRTRAIPVPAPPPAALVRLLASDLPGRVLSPPDVGSRAGPPGITGTRIPRA